MFPRIAPTAAEIFVKRALKINQDTVSQQEYGYKIPNAFRSFAENVKRIVILNERLTKLKGQLWVLIVADSMVNRQEPEETRRVSLD